MVLCAVVHIFSARFLFYVLRREVVLCYHFANQLPTLLSGSGYHHVDDGTMRIKEQHEAKFGVVLHGLNERVISKNWIARPRRARLRLLLRNES